VKKKREKALTVSIIEESITLRTQHQDTIRRFIRDQSMTNITMLLTMVKNLMKI